jgi:hypothetical protein
MTCPPEVAQVVLGLLSRGLVRIRRLGWSGRGSLCAAEADHLHNLPDLLANYSEERLRYYWDVERACYLRHVPPEQSAWLIDLWDELHPFAESLSSPANAP